MTRSRSDWVWVVLGLGTLTLLNTRSDKPRVPGMNVKDGVTLWESRTGTVSDELIRIRQAVLDVWSEYGYTPTITSSFRDDSGSPHSRGHAEDYRIRDLPNNALWFTFAADVSRHESLNDTYQVIVENDDERWYYRDGVFEGYKQGQAIVAGHMHVEYDGG